VASAGVSDRPYPYVTGHTGQNVGERQCCSEAAVALRGTACLPAMGILSASVIQLMKTCGYRRTAFRE
jgi:hypothetical protein